MTRHRALRTILFGTGPALPALLLTLTILPAREMAAAAAIRFSEAEYRVLEGQEELFALVMLTDCPTRKPDGRVTVEVFATDASAEEAADYFVFSRFEMGLVPPPPGSKLDRVYRTQEVPIVVIDDALAENDEEFLLELHVPEDAAIDCGEGPEKLEVGPASLVTIVSNDEHGATVEFEAARVSWREGDGAARHMVIPVVRHGISAASVLCAPTGRATAIPGEDFAASAQRLTWAEGESGAKECSLELLPDDLVEGDETVELELREPGPEVEIGPQRTVHVTINDDDDAGQVQFASVEFIALEHSREALVSVARLGGSDGEVKVRYQVQEGSARAGRDFQAAEGELSWSAGDDGMKRIHVQLLDDDDEEEAETVLLALTDPTGGGRLGSLVNTVLRIRDDDVGRVQTSARSRPETAAQATAIATTVPAAAPDGRAARVRGDDQEHDVRVHLSRIERRPRAVVVRGEIVNPSSQSQHARVRVELLRDRSALSVADLELAVSAHGRQEFQHLFPTTNMSGLYTARLSVGGH